MSSPGAEKERAAAHAAGSAVEPGGSEAVRALVRRHLCFGWWSLLVFATLGVALELMHGFKLGLYLDVANDTRRLMWTLAHAHGALLGLVHVAFAFTLTSLGRAADPPPRAASPCLLGASILLPTGFFLGGAWIYGGDPGRGILLVPVGAALLLAAILTIALRASRSA